MPQAFQDDAFQTDAFQTDGQSIAARSLGDAGYRDHAAEMIDRLPEQFRPVGDDDNNIVKFLKVLAAPIQDLQSACDQVLLQRSIETAIGQQLDDLGAIVLEPRNGLSDDLYRRRVRARTSVHKSRGTVEDLIKVTSLVLFDPTAVIRVVRQTVATVVVRVEETSVTDEVADAILFDFLKLTASVGVRVILESGSSDFDGLFRLDSGPGLDVGHFADARG